MITIHPESFKATLPELKEILPLHWDELALNKEKVPLDPQYDLYFKYEDTGQLLFMVIRENGKIAGYFIGMIAPGLHYRTCLTCTMDIFYIHPEHRGAAMLGVKLFRAVEKECKRRGVDRMYVGSKVKADASILFERLGYGRIEVFYSKWIGE